MDPSRMESQNDNAPAPRPGPGCPQCVTTGTVGVLHDICDKQGIVNIVYTVELQWLEH